MYNQQYTGILEIQVLTGMHIGEVLGLEISEISFDTHLATIKRTRATHGGVLKKIMKTTLRNNKVIVQLSYRLKLCFFLRTS
ncbi:hypothetical protein JL739_11570 [Listeria welshimeri]|uniref:Uncharacterized protein n=1 Tax=Listeria welshimeri TaxID=1643 RepID=A0A7X0T8Y8_LISWE|nr:hypothetical protein [Listeria welshimeri]MBC1323960.1 hypothetical protein [Listeria welshimeri]MBC1698982.1 hypothetical protein [Listeria welshimeri]MBS9361743.1 hypothetical protein [Listeria welshimeri]